MLAQQSTSNNSNINISLHGPCVTADGSGVAVVAVRGVVGGGGSWAVAAAASAAVYFIIIY